MFSDGILLVDLERAESVQSTIQKFSRELKILCLDYRTLIEVIKQRKMEILIVVINCEIIKPDHELHSEAI